MRLPACGVAAGTSQRWRHHRHQRLQYFQRPPVSQPKSTLEAERQHLPARSPPPGQSLGLHGGDRWERAGARGREFGRAGGESDSKWGRGAEGAVRIGPGPVPLLPNPRHLKGRSIPRQSPPGAPDYGSQPQPLRGAHPRARTDTHARLVVGLQRQWFLKGF